VTAALRVAIQGERGAYSEEAALALYGQTAEIVPCRTLKDVFAALDAGRADAAAVPVENSRAGTIVETYDLLLTHRYPVTGEYRLRVRHCLLGLPGTSIADVRRAQSHPQALSQCSLFLQQHGISPESAYDTAGAAAYLARRRDPAAAAIASRRAAELFGLEILAEGIEDRQDNVTRFLALVEPPALAAGPGRTLLAFTVPNEPRALFRCLEPFARHECNLTKLESRPDLETAFDYVFYLDVDGRADRPPVAEALAELAGIASSYRMLGSFGA
jgi:prephenate dehydratase